MADAVTSEPRSRKRAIAILVLVVLAAMLSIAAVRLRKSPEERAMESLAGFVIARGQQTKMLPERLAYFGFSVVLIVSALVRAMSAAVAAAFF